MEEEGADGDKIAFFFGLPFGVAGKESTSGFFQVVVWMEMTGVV